MPLPDERPRASVANLIGRFEQQTKRQSLTPTNGPRPSIASHSTGESAKEEVKEKREWPPKLAQAENPSSSILPSSSSPPLTSQIVAEPPHVAEPAAVNSALESTSTPAPAATSPPPAAQLAKPHRQSTPGTPSKASSVTRVHSSPVKTLKEHQKAPSTTTRSPPKTSTTLTAPPLKQQHTGQSTTSNTTARRSIAKTTASTPGRPKTPSRASLSKPSTPSRPKTPSANTIRPKTPSNLFAPTAASLAKARNTTEPRSTPMKKATLSSSAADRLSKPTAASMSKARSPVPPSPAPARGTAKPTSARGVAVLRGTTKARGGIRLKPSAGVTAAGAVGGATVGEFITSGSEGEEVAHTETAEEVQEPVHEEPVHEEPVHEELVHEELVHEEERSVPGPEPESASPEHEEAGAPVEDSLAAQDPAAIEESLVDAAPDAHNIEPMPTGSDKTAVDEDETKATPDARLDEVKPRPDVDDDLVAMVNMLESKAAPTFRDENATDAVDQYVQEVQEIPDED